MHRLIGLIVLVFVTACSGGDSTAPSSSEVRFMEDAGASQKARLDVPVLAAPVLRAGEGVLSWSAVAGATGYQLVSCGAVELSTVHIGSGSITEHRFTGLLPGAGYGIKIRARKVTGQKGVPDLNSNFSDCLSWTGAYAVASISISPATATVQPGATQQYVATLRDVNGTPLTGREITWASSASAVATVSVSGLASALTSGTTSISASSEGITATAMLVVQDPLATLDLIFEEHNNSMYLTIGTMKGDGSQRRIITNGVHPAWHGNTVLTRGTFGDNRIFRMNSDGSSRTQILGSGPSYVPDFSPDGSKFTLVYGDCNGGHRIAIANVDGSGLRHLGICAGYPRWSQAGDRISYVMQGNVYHSDLNGGTIRQLVNNGAGGESTWSPDGTQLVIAYRVSGKWQLYRINADGSGLRPLVPFSGADDYLPDWSPRGDYIVFLSNRTGKLEHWRIKIDGTGLTRLTNTTLVQGIVKWRK